MLKPGDIAIVSGARTPMGRYCGKLKDFTAQELGAVAAQGAIERSGVDPKEFDHVVFGNAQQTSGDALYGARHVGLRAGLADRNSGPDREPAVRIGHAGHRQRGADDSDRRSEDRAGGRHGSDVAGAVRHPRARRLHARAGRQARRLADGRAARYLLRACTWRTPPSCMASSRASRGRCRMNSRCARSRWRMRPTKKDVCRKNWCRCRCEIPSASRPARC